MESNQYRAVSGMALVAVGVVAILGIITAEALYPGYSTAQQTISALGAADAPHASRVVFNAGMVGAGILTVLAAYGLHHVYGRRLLTAIVAITGGVGLVGVGAFPVETGGPHAVASMTAFLGVGLAALLLAGTIHGTFRYVSAILGGLELVAFGLFITLGDATPLGIGGLERWVAYLAVSWAIAFGGMLLSDPSDRPDR